MNNNNIKNVNQTKFFKKKFFKQFFFKFVYLFCISDVLGKSQILGWNSRFFVDPKVWSAENMKIWGGSQEELL